MNEKAKQTLVDILTIFDRLSETKQQCLLGVAMGMDLASTHAQPQPDQRSAG